MRAPSFSELCVPEQFPHHESLRLKILCLGAALHPEERLQRIKKLQRPA
jgi:hypothetical protein